MENATKALLIAAAILIAILIISLSLVVYRMASETVGSVNLSEAEMAEFNGKFEAYTGARVSGASVNALLATVLTHNQNETAAGGNRTVVVRAGNANNAATLLTTTATSYTKVNASRFYNVQCVYTNGIVTRVNATAL